MSPPPAAAGPATPVAAAFDRRVAAGTALADDAEQVARACHDMAQRFARGGKLIVFGSGAAATDAQHLAVEFVHPVIVGKRAFPAISLTGDVATLTGVADRDGVGEMFARQLRLLADPDDIALGLSTSDDCVMVRRGLAAARELGLLTLALTGGDRAPAIPSALADHVFVARSADPRIVKEVHVTTYHVLWELVHVFFEHPGVLDPVQP
jgi:D-sedoheptulose 7-phosphate isomerase